MVDGNVVLKKVMRIQEGRLWTACAKNGSGNGAVLRSLSGLFRELP